MPSIPSRLHSRLRHAAFTLLAALLISPAISLRAETTGGEATLPDSRLGRDFGIWLEHLNDADEERLRGYVESRFSAEFLERFPVETLVAFHLQQRERGGRLTPWQPLREALDGIETLARGSFGGWFRLRFQQAVEPPHPIVLLQILPAEAPETPQPATAPADVTPKGLSDSPLGRIAAEFVAAFNSADEAALIAFENRHRYRAGLGAQPAEMRGQRHLQLRQEVGRIEAQRLLSEEADQLVLLARAEALEAWLRLELRGSGDSPVQLRTLRVRQAHPEEIAATETPEPGWRDLRDLLRRARGERTIPALGAAYWRGGEIVEEAVVGTRQAGGRQDALAVDLFHFGSVTKPLTATMIARLVEAGTLSWETTVGEVLEGVDMREAYRGVTVEELLRHRGRVPPYTSLNAQRLAELVALPGTATGQRGAFVAELLREEPLADGMTYSNAGYALVAHLAERRSGRSWRELLHNEVFGPAGMAGAGFGWPATADRPEQPRGHFGAGKLLRPQGLEEYPLPAALDPAGHVHGTLGDLLRFGALHLAGLQGRDGALRAATVRRLHAPPDAAGAERQYGSGWVLAQAPDGRPMHWHNGSAGTFYTWLALFPEDDLVFAFVCNTSPTLGEPVALEVMKGLLERLGLTAGGG